jgi:HAD superfamily hydrolase (TIGR01484 family)
MKPDVFLCSDLDRTILPNGAQPESPQARPALRTVASHPQLMLAYVSGRHEQLLREAIQDYAIPQPDYAIGDVGTSIYRVKNDKWEALPDWAHAIAVDWNGAKHRDLRAMFADLDVLSLQETEKQNTFKLSYYTPVAFDRKGILEEMQQRLIRQHVEASLIWSVDEAAGVGLLDVLPASATKLHAVEFLMQLLEFNDANTVFAGDSGNDLPVLTSGKLQAVLVRNAHPDVVAEAREELAKIDATDKLYVAQGGFLGMNGNYSAGVLEGLAHFIPFTAGWVK